LGGGFDELMRRLLFELDSLAPSPDQRRALRALGVLERAGNPEARKLLQALAGGAPEAALTVQAKAALDRLAKVEPEPAGAAPEALWEALAGADSAAAYRAVRALADRPAAAALLRDHLTDLAAGATFNDDSKRVAKLIGDLDSDDFGVREQASKGLRNLGRLVVLALRQALAAKPGPEAKRRLEQLLGEGGKAPSPEVLRVGRALEALELMRGPEARPALEALAKDARVPWLREAAGESLRRRREGTP
jgi:hypothetical protein